MRWLAKIFILTLAITGPVKAEFSGDNDPKFQTAVEFWLEGENLQAGRLLLQLAKDNNRSAQLLLGQIYLHRRTLWPEVLTLEPMEQRQFFRTSLGLGGKSWLTVLAENEPLAGHIQKITTSKASETLLPLYRAKEFHSLAIALLIASNQDGYIKVKNIGAVLEPAPPFDLRFDPLNLVKAYSKAQGSNQWATYPGEFWGYLSPPKIQLASNPELWALAIKNFNKLLEFSPARTTCQEICPGTAESCTAAMLTTAPREQLLQVMYSPAEALIPTTRYTKSNRFSRDLLSFLRTHVRESEMMLSLDSCLHSFVYAKSP